MTAARRGASIVVVTVTVLLALGAIGVFGLRAAVGGLVRSEEFRETTARLIERSLRPIVPNAMVHVGASNLTGLLSVELTDVTVRSSHNMEATLTFATLVVKPALASLVLPGPYRAEAVAHGGGGAELHLNLAVPRSAFLGETKAGDTVDVTGDGTRLDAAKLGLLILGGNGIPSLKVMQGMSRTTFSFSRALTPADATRSWSRRGQIEWITDDLTLALATDEARAVALPELRLGFTLDDYVLSIAQPVLLPDPTGQATLVGKIVLPQQADTAPAWDLEVTVSDTPAFATALPRVLGCEQLPATGHYKVTGPVARSRCVDL